MANPGLGSLSNVQYPHMPTVPIPLSYRFIPLADAIFSPICQSDVVALSGKDHVYSCNLFNHPRYDICFVNAPDCIGPGQHCSHAS